MSAFREEIIGDCRLILGDCREVLPTLPKVDAVVTDPPYGIGFRGYASHDDNPEEYADLISVLRGIPCAVLQYPEDLISKLVPILGPPTEVLAWVYPSNLPRQFRLWGVWGLACDWSKAPQPAKNPECSKVKTAYVASYDWWEQPQVKGNSSEKTDHPCQIPVTSVERVLRITDPLFVLDPFMGSGTTGVACVNLGRSFIGIEREPAYFDIACRRIEEAYKQPRLFDEPTHKPVQGSLLEGAA